MSAFNPLRTVRLRNASLKSNLDRLLAATINRAHHAREPRGFAEAFSRDRDSRPAEVYRADVTSARQRLPSFLALLLLWAIAIQALAPVELDLEHLDPAPFSAYDDDVTLLSLGSKRSSLGLKASSDSDEGPGSLAPPPVIMPDGSGFGLPWRATLAPGSPSTKAPSETELFRSFQPRAPPERSSRA
jgi:hypothetical protein